MRQRVATYVVVLLVMAVAGCLAWTRTAPPLYQDGFLTVSLEPNPAGNGTAQSEKDIRAITSEQLATTLRGLYVQKKAGFLQSVIASQPERVFREAELSLVARELQKGLRQASPQERVAFQLWRPRGRGREETSGAIYLRGSLLHATLTKFRSPDAVMYKDAEYGSGTDFELLYEPSEAMVQKQQGFASRWLGADPTEVIVDIQRVTGSNLPAASGAVPDRSAMSPEPTVPPQTPPVAAPPKIDPAMTPQTSQASSDVTVEAFQRQIKELTEELTRLRQELAEIKQLLADKVLELNRLKNESSGAAKGKAP